MLYGGGIGLPQPLFFSKTCIIFYLVGGLIGRYYFDFFSNPREKKFQVVAAIIVFLGIIYFELAYYKVIEEEALIEVIILIVLSLGFWNMLDLFLPATSISKVPDFMKHSFWIYALHVNVSAVVTKLLYLFLPKNPCIGILNFGLTTILTLFIIEVACKAINKISPSLYSLLSGNR